MSGARHQNSGEAMSTDGDPDEADLQNDKFGWSDRDLVGIVFHRARPARAEAKPVHPTAQRLIDATLELLERLPVEKVLVEEVLERSGVSRSSLYHHFEDFPDLVEHALAAQFASVSRALLALLSDLSDTPRSAEDFRQRVLAANRSVHSPENFSYRMRRVVTFAAADRNERFRRTLAREQQLLTDGYVDMVFNAQRHGWVDQDLDPDAVAVLLQACATGRIVDDVAERHVDPTQWIDTVTALLDRLLFRR